MNTEPIVHELMDRLGLARCESATAARQRLQHRLTQAPAGTLPAAVWPGLAALWRAEAEQRPRVVAADLPRLAAHGLGARVALWHGDITHLEVQAIVNAANSGLTGCYVPGHACVDNAIHRAAGPWLRQACAAVMADRGRPEPTGTATRTPGFFLPAAQVVHTVGPIVAGRRPTETDRSQLAACYRSSCEAAVQGTQGLASIAFCSISTGLFGYPIEQAAPVALQAVRAALLEFPQLAQVVLVSFSAHDAAVMAAAAREVQDLPPKFAPAADLGCKSRPKGRSD